MHFKDKNHSSGQAKVIAVLRNVFDPEIPVNIFDLGLIYDIQVADNKNIDLTMTLTAPNCPLADEVLAEVYEKIKSIPWVKEVNVNLTFDPPWDRNMMTEAALLELGLL